MFWEVVLESEYPLNRSIRNIAYNNGSIAVASSSSSVILPSLVELPEARDVDKYKEGFVFITDEGILITDKKGTSKLIRYDILHCFDIIASNDEDILVCDTECNLIRHNTIISTLTFEKEKSSVGASKPSFANDYWFVPVWQGYCGSGGGKLYVWDGKEKKAVIDLPKSPVYSSADGNVLVVAYEKAIDVFDVSDPSKPSRISFIDGFSWIWRVDVKGNLVLVADFDKQKVHIVSIKGKRNTEIETGKPGGVKWINNYKFVVGRTDGTIMLYKLNAIGRLF